MVCDCLVELEHVFLEKKFTYKIPNDLEDNIKVGMRVEVSFGHQILEGFVMNIRDKNDKDVDLKTINRLVDTYPVLNDELLKLGVFIKNTTLSSLMSSYQVMLPKALKARKKVNMNIKKEDRIRFAGCCSNPVFYAVAAHGCRRCGYRPDSRSPRSVQAD